MAPLPEERAAPSACAGGARAHSGDDVVISGMSGAYPSSHSVRDLADILYNKKNPINTDNPRWNHTHPELPRPIGKIPKLHSFDAQFFKVHYRLGNNMDPMSRKLLEQTYAAVYDAGYSPAQLWGKRIGVYVGSCFSETEKASFYVASVRNGFGIAGCSKAMFANRISYWLNLKGPSMSTDAACASSAMALERAYEAISRGDCEAAIVGGANICLHPQSSVHYGRTMSLCMDGKTKTFDKHADGCARADAINVLYLQKSNTAKRIYATVCHVKSKFEPMDCEMGQKYGPYRDEDQLASFIKEFYEEARVSPSAVEYVETFGSAEPKADKSELEAISKVFCKDRINPLLVGSAMSNIGYTEAASTITAITKVLLSYHNGNIPANLHCNNPRDDVVALRDGSMRVVTEHQPFQRTYVGVNCTSVTGLNVHLLLHGHYKPKDLTKYRTNIPHLVMVSGRQESAVHKILNDLKSRSVDPEEIALFHSIHENNISGHLGRGFTILGTNGDKKTVSLVEKVEYFDDAQRPLWFVYSGMGSQWATMGAQLMRIPVFAAAIERCQKVLAPKGIDIVHIITSPDKETFDNILNSFVGIAACQIGLTDVLRELGLVPDKVIGHSVGELGCAYADGCFTAEEMILAAYSRGLVSVQTPFIHGSMAAVGVGYEQVKSMCPPEIEVACHNSSESSTISGPSAIMKEFVEQLTAKGIFAKEVPCSNIAYHSRYIKEAGPNLLKLLKEVIKSPKARSDRWFSTSVPKDKWNTTAAKYSSAEYHTNNLLNPVLFEETSSLVPANAVLIEVAPHGLLQAILKRSLPESCVNVPLTRRGHADNALFLLEALGKLYLHGYNPKLQSLYPKVEFPVSTGTPLLSHHVEWAHTEKWSLALYASACKKIAASANFIVSIHDDEHSHLRGNVHQNDTLYPFGGVLVLVWDTFAMMSGVTRRELSVQFQDVHLHIQPRLYEDQVLRLSVQLLKGSGYFEVTSDNIMIASGYIQAQIVTNVTFFKEASMTEQDGLVLSSEDVYKMFHERGSYYKGQQRSIISINEEMTKAQISWNGYWATLLDSMIQMNALRRDHDGITHPCFIRCIIIDIKEHYKEMLLHDTHKEIPMDKKSICFDATFFKLQDTSRCGGVVMENIKFNDQPRTRQETVGLKALKFTPFIQYDTIQVSDALDVFLQIVEENINNGCINIVAVQTYEENCLQGEIMKMIDSIPNVKINYNVVKPEDITKNRKGSLILREATLVVVKNLSTTGNTFRLLHGALEQGVFILVNESSGSGAVPQALCRAVASASTPHGRLQLCRWRPAVPNAPSAAVSVNEHGDLAHLREARQSLRLDHRLVVLSRYPPPHGLKELVQKWRKEPERNKIHVAMINHKIAQDQNLDQLPNFDLVFNVLDHGTWGGVYMVQPEELAITTERGLILRNAVAGDLSSLYWEEGSRAVKDELAVTVHYAGLNMRDARSATGAIPFKLGNVLDVGYGMDFSGITNSGSRVMGVVRGGAASSRVSAESALLWPVPAHWTLEDAATVPLPYAHAFYCLCIKFSLDRGMRVLVHGASGALGMAVVSIALALECEVFATVSDVRKKQFLQRMFPILREDHIGNSRGISFGAMVKHHTRGKGCDLVISCLEGELKNEAIKCVGMNGYLLDTHQIPNKENYLFGMGHLMGSRNYIPIDFSTIFSYKKTAEMELLRLCVSEGISRGYVRPLSRVTYGPLEAARAFTLLANSRHRGRALLRIHGEVLSASPRLAISPADAQLVMVSSADDAFVVRVINTLVDRGATNVVLHRHAQHASTVNAYMQIKIKSWQKLGVRVKILTGNLADAQSLVKGCMKLGPVQGVFLITSGQLDDKTQLEFTTMVADMDAITRKLCPMLKYFVVIGEGVNVGQDVCINRAHDRLPATILSLPKINTFVPWQSDTVDNDNRGLSYAAAVEAMERAARATSNVLVAQTVKDVVTATKRAAENTDPTGLSIFFDHIDNDELMATMNVVKMQTITQNTMECDDDFVTNNDPNLVIIPGLDGHYGNFLTLCERLKLPAVVLQPGNDFPNETVQEMAERFFKVVSKQLNPQEKFYLLGYSFGVLVALELASLLEKEGLTGVVYCVDASPDTFSKTLKTCLGDLTMLQDNLIKHMYTLMSGKSPEEALGRKLKQLSSWREKVEECVATLRGHVPHSSQYARDVISAAYGRIEQARRYSGSALVARPLGSRLVVLRSRWQPAAAPHDLGLCRYSRHAPTVYTLHEGHARALTDLRVPNLINRHLDNDIHIAYRDKNLCETYLVNESTFVMRDSLADSGEIEDVI